MGWGEPIGRRRGLAGVALTAATFCFTAAPAAAVPVLDAECLGPPTFLLGPIAPNQRVAQTFSAQTSGSLIQGRVEIQEPASGTGDWVMEVYATDNSGNPVNPALATTTVSDAMVPTGDSTLIGRFQAPASVEPGEQYALSVARSAGFFLRARGGDPCPGSLFATDSAGMWFAAAPGDSDLVFMVLVEPTPEVTPPPEADANPPTATITSGPNDKTSRKQATFSFTGADTRAVAGFECSLDGGAFAPCTSPHSLTVGRGNHTFSVRATDDSGNVGSAATDAWKVKKKKRKRG